MSYFLPGYSEARARFQTAPLGECLSLIDDLFGRDNLDDESDLDEVRAEALRQLREEFTDRESEEFERADFWTKVVLAQQRGAR